MPLHKKPKILIATGGTGGHIFPAQALAIELFEKNYELLFAGGGLKANRYFNRGRFPYSQVASATPFKGNPFKSLFRIGKGIKQSLKLIDEFKPDIVVGFGSFYSFPVLAAARWRKIPIVLFEPNAIPGKVNRLVSKWALLSAVQFSEAGNQLSGTIIEVKMPVGERKHLDAGAARDYFYLDHQSFTFLVFGGSQGAESINRLFSESILKVIAPVAFQVIHITGKTDSAELIRRQYEAAGIRACVKAFEERMELAWSAADAVIGRSGAASIAELIKFEVPGILVPFPQAADDHQTKNALFIERKVGGAITCPESSLTAELLKPLLEKLMLPSELKKMKKAISSFKQDHRKKELSSVICEILKERTA
ncbi:MAG TPA: UDP-N-acetylglucosamine--N-acetylmuramyl-(pentapeptide) pyrophosphoryl-undecaprenol N-acetylglucosamine transferase [Rhabdochlamydiaceae bacterium]|nr:UDP-N-acetylglucosamine--N-acetylmuramyl-(pentapeptide) pyrophosphoryl-undecaprenol N-acetylglucosamine transferase [Rhabdochlamydiaceae bacterium]